MTKKLTILIIAGVMALVVVLVMVVTHKSPETETGIMGLREAEQGVRRLKEKLRAPADEATRERTDSLIKDFARDHEYVEINGEKHSLSTVAVWELQKIGESAIPRLIDAAASEKNPVRVRQYALGMIYRLSRDDNSKLVECLPVFVRSTHDKNPEVRGVAVSQIGLMAIRANRKGGIEIDPLIAHLVRALGDEDKGVRRGAGQYLYNIGREDLIPKKLMEEARYRDFTVTILP